MRANQYDYIIAGAGLAGLSLAAGMARRPFFSKKRILLLDRDDKTRNDRTWCFWAKDEEALPPVAAREWAKGRVLAPDLDTDMRMDGYRYRMVRSADFYAWAKSEAAAHPQLDFVQTTIRSIEPNEGRVLTDAGAFEAEWVFNSAFAPAGLLPPAGGAYAGSPFSAGANVGEGRYSFFLQHFKGRFLRVGRDAFDPEQITLMDFRIPQRGETRFVYVLPFGKREALVEFTVFSPALLPAEAYEAALNDYLRNCLKLDAWDIFEEEFGVIPMTDLPLRSEIRGREIAIGTAGGFVKASSGYAFKRTWRKIGALLDDWERSGRPRPRLMRSPARFAFFDSVLLQVLRNGEIGGAEAFAALYRKLPASLVLRFLDEDSSWTDNLRVMAAAPRGPFLKAAFQKILR
ncbi:MAG: lycopene cyclase family protein [Saprospiraceae bacterium]